MALSIRARDRAAVAVAIGGPFLVAAALVPLRASIRNTDAALLMVVVVVAVAVTGRRLAGYLAAASCALWFDFWLTEPYQRFAMNRREDVETAVLLLLIGMIVTELAVWGWRQRAVATMRAEQLGRIFAAREVALSRSQAAITDVEKQLVEVLKLRACRFEPGVAGLGATARLQSDGTLDVAGRRWDVEAVGFPVDREIELVVEGGGRLHGRFMIVGRDDARPSLEDRLVAAVLAEQLGAALARHQSVNV